MTVLQSQVGRGRDATWSTLVDVKVRSGARGHSPSDRTSWWNFLGVGEGKGGNSQNAAVRVTPGGTHARGVSVAMSNLRDQKTRKRTTRHAGTCAMAEHPVDVVSDLCYRGGGRDAGRASSRDALAWAS